MLRPRMLAAALLAATVSLVQARAAEPPTLLIPETKAIISRLQPEGAPAPRRPEQRPDLAQRLRRWQTGGPVYLWNQEAVAALLNQRQGNLPASRVLALLHAALYDVALVAEKAMFGAIAIPRAEVARAKLDYATTAQVGSRLVPDPSMGFLRMLARELRRLGLDPVVGDGGAAGRTGQLIWRAEDITAADHDALSAWARRLGWTRTKGRRTGSRGRES